MSYTVEKIGGTSMSAFDAVLDNILLRPHHPYDRVFVVSAYATITDALLECKRTGKPGIYQMIAKHDTQWQEAMYQLEQRMLLINEHLFADPMSRIRADKFIRSRISEAVNCINNILETCQYGQFSLRQYLPQVREFLSSIGEAHSAYNTSLKLKTLGINACFIDLSGWNNGQAGSLDEVILTAFEDIDVATQLPIVTGYAYCNEGLMKTYDRGYSEMTFSRIAALTNATQAIIHKEYHLSSADPRIVGADKVSPMGLTNFDVADQLANLGMEAIHPNAAAGLRQQGIELRIKNTFEPEHKGTLISNVHKPQNNKVEIIAGKDKVFALHIFDQSMVGKIDNASYELMEVIAEAKVHLVGKEMNANSMTYYLSGSCDNLNHVLYKIEKRYPNASVSGKMVALISAIGASMNTNNALTQGMQALVNAKISPIAAHSSMRNVNVQFVVEDNDYNRAICVLHDVLIAKPLSTKKAA
ncbi:MULTISPECIES: aspartate kinase [unclassified Vibrio]|uniref:aspartate kinase n=1 Tax=unclassified Vibrio TaxID=2614977 RepID=UPI000B8EA7E4|nr:MULTISPECIES: aspartate kinase [unclassified Vibrio]NAW90600.1 aspartate kinase [Vibrio sp. V24_P1S3T111]OXX19703.1 aspartate kinase [Vibrio sp. V06_P1A73T115]OXX25300.1 aspartate kinase [Vibrio sp. V05_P4A8T149]OXX29069.1 aspartate kinase [Vibrio sp. V14_P6S14T42]OXX34491.1 aspartate kinase [Vibrio sp. V04_P4A5T148]